MANRTSKDASTVKGTNPQFLVEKIIRQRIYDSQYWKEHCFALTAELIVDRGMELRYVGGIYAGNVKPTPFLCLTLKMLQIQPEKDIAIEFIKQEEFKYIRALGALYLRLTFPSIEIYKYLEPLYNDFRKLRYMNTQGRFELVHMDEFIDNLLRQERCCDIQMPRLQKRSALEETDELEPYKSILDDDLDAMSASSDSDDDDKRKERPRLIARRHGSRDRERDRSIERERRKERDLRGGDKRDRSRDRGDERRDRDRKDDKGRRERSGSKERKGRRDRDRDDRNKDKDRSSRRDDRGKDDKKRGRDDEERQIAEANELRAKLGLAPLQR